MSLNEIKHSQQNVGGYRAQVVGAAGMCKLLIGRASVLQACAHLKIVFSPPHARRREPRLPRNRHLREHLFRLRAFSGFQTQTPRFDWAGIQLVRPGA